MSFVLTWQLALLSLVLWVGWTTASIAAIAITDAIQERRQRRTMSGTQGGGQ